MLTTQLKDALRTMGKDGLMATEAVALLQLSGSAAQAAVSKALSAMFLRGDIAREEIGRGTGKASRDWFRYFDKKALRERKAEARAEAKAATERVAAKLNGGAVQAAIAEAAKPEQAPAEVLAKHSKFTPEMRAKLGAMSKAAWVKRKAAKAAELTAAPVKQHEHRFPLAKPVTIDTAYFTITITPKEVA